MGDIDELYFSLIEAFPGAALMRDAGMAAYTSFRTGGRAKLVLDAGGREEILLASAQAARLDVPYYIIGNGTNLLVSDRGLDALVVRVGERIGRTAREGNRFEAEAGASLAAFAKGAVEAGFSGLEWAAGIPGTVGGAVAMNAGAYGGEIAQVLKEVTVIENGAVARVAVRPDNMGYRRSAFRAPGRIVLSACFELPEDDGSAAVRMREYNAARREKQPLSFPSAGSTFKRPQGYFAGRLIEEAGLKGARIGGAEVSRLHAGFLINAGGATSADVYALIRFVQHRVYEHSGVTLEPEVMLLGDFE
ncbi:MAG TPA: UDP-N-acetylmuramate dehydrogenase [Clostridia bacterium]|nr:UDP-N-acetylmuramate dehydrogenase [Clostridia bacterium]